MPASRECIGRMHGLCVFAPGSTPASFKFVEVSPAYAIVMLAVTSQVHRWKFLLLYPLIDALFMHLQFTGNLLNGQFYRSLSHRTTPQKRIFLVQGFTRKSPDYNVYGKEVSMK
jgi:hypothetical protein